MKRFGILILLLGAGLFLVQCSHSEEKPTRTSQPVQQGGAPVAQFPETSHDLGQISEGQEYSHEFLVKNAGTGVLEIKKVLPGWGSQAFWDKAISPGKEGKIKIVVSPAKCSGGYKKSIVVTTNDPQTPYQMLYLTGHP